MGEISGAYWNRCSYKQFGDLIIGIKEHQTNLYSNLETYNKIGDPRCVIKLTNFVKLPSQQRRWWIFVCKTSLNKKKPFEFYFLTVFFVCEWLLFRNNQKMNIFLFAKISNDSNEKVIILLNILPVANQLI